MGDAITDQIENARSAAAFLEPIKDKGPFPHRVSWYNDGWGRCDIHYSYKWDWTVLAPLGPNLVEHYWQYGTTDEYWWGTYLVDLLKQHAQDRTLTYRNFKNWYDSTYGGGGAGGKGAGGGGGSLTSYLEYLQVYPLEFERALFWLSRNPDKINFDTLKRLLRSMRLVLLINGVPTSKVRFMYDDEFIKANSYGSVNSGWSQPYIYIALRLFNTLQYKMTAAQSQTMKPYVEAMMKQVYRASNFRGVGPIPAYWVPMTMYAVIVVANELGIDIPYKAHKSLWPCQGIYA